MNKVELLAPAGNFSKLKTAFYFGADAAYLGGKSFSLRSFADNFSVEQIAEAAAYAHGIGKKVYVTVNIYANNADLIELPEYLRALEGANVDGIIASDAGVISLAKQVAPSLQIHLSTQANTTNLEAVRFWHGQGVSRVVLARELSIKEITEIHNQCPTCELEAFVHGAMCISYSGRCLLSNYFAGRNSNRGECVQACRWQYELVRKDGEHGKSCPIEEDGRGTYVLNSKDLNLSEHLKELADAGISSFKIEGRMKSEYYIATIINAYRRAIDLAYEGKPLSDDIKDELKNAAHRDYTTAFALGENDDTINYDDSQTKGSCEFIGLVKAYADGYVYLEMRNRFRTGEQLEILSPDENYKKTFTVEQMQDASNEACDDAKHVLEVYKLRCPYTLKVGDIIRRRND